MTSFTSDSFCFVNFDSLKLYIMKLSWLKQIKRLAKKKKKANACYCGIINHWGFFLKNKKRDVQEASVGHSPLKIKCFLGTGPTLMQP